VARGKRRVSLNYYLAMLEKVIAARLAREFVIWNEISFHFYPTLQSLHRVRKRMNIRPSDYDAAITVFEETGEWLI